MASRLVGLLCAALGLLAVTSPADASVANREGVIAYSVKTGIYSIHADGTDPRLLVPWQPSSCGHSCVVWKVPRNPRYSPDGRQLTYDLETYVVRHGVGGEAQLNTREVYVADADGQRRRPLGAGHHPEFSPDGKEVIFLLDPNAYPPIPLLEEPPMYGADFGPMEAVDIDSGARRRLAVPGASEISADGKRMLAYRQVRAPKGIAWAQTLENVDGAEPHDYFLPTFYAELPRFTATGELSYDCPSVGDEQPDICLFDPSTERSRRLLHVAEFWALEAASSPDGRRFAIAGLQGMYVTDADGRHAHRIIRNGAGPNYVQSDVPTSPTWRPSP